MQDRYTGDVGDFGKYGLLRALSLSEITDEGGPRLSLGVVWYRYHDESHNADGKHISYLDPHKQKDYRKCDPELYDCLSEIVNNRVSRKISEIEKSEILGSKTRYFSEECPGGSRQSRFEWHKRALTKMRGCDLVFLDPDNGLVKDIKDEVSAKHVYFCEVQDFVYLGGALVFYHHLNRSTTHDRQIEHQLRWLAGKFRDSHHVAAFRYRRGTSRVFFVIWPAHLHEILWPCMQAVSDSQWTAEGHFDSMISLESPTDS